MTLIILVLDWGKAMERSVKKRSVVIHGHKSSISLENPFWEGLRDIARRRGVTMQEMVNVIDANRKQANLSSAIRLFVLSAFQDQLAPRPEFDGAAANGWPVAAQR